MELPDSTAHASRDSDPGVFTQNAINTFIDRKYIERKKRYVKNSLVELKKLPLEERISRLESYCTSYSIGEKHYNA